jgi:hypothetical protein
LRLANGAVHVVGAVSAQRRHLRRRRVATEQGLRSVDDTVPVKAAIGFAATGRAPRAELDHDPPVVPAGAVERHTQPGTDARHLLLVHDGWDLPAEAITGPAHPLHLGTQVTARSEVFADYEILQPFRSWAAR